VKAILLAGGLGTRLRPITLTCPKPLLPIGNLPLVQRIVLNLRASGIKEFVFLLHYQPQQFIDTLGDGQKFDARFRYVVMEKDLSTAGSVRFAADHITETTLIYAGDIIADLPLRRMLVFHKRRRALATLALHPVAAPLPFGLVLRDGDGRVRRFFEKPTWPQVFSDWINASIYLVEPELIDHIPSDDRPVFFEKEVFPLLATAGAAIFGFPITGYWRDVGTPEDLRLANMDYLNGRLPQKMLTPDERTWHIPSIGKSASHYVVGLGGKIAPDAHLEASVIGANSHIESHVQARGAVIFDDVHLGKGVQIDNAILMRGVEVEAKAEIHHNAVIAECAHIGAAAIIAPNAIVRKETRVAPGNTISAKRVLPTGYIRGFVDGGSLLGSAKSGMSADFMRWVGKTFALRQRQFLEKGAVRHLAMENFSATALLATQDEEHFSGWTKALAQGVLSAGCDVHLLESVTLPVARWALQQERYAGGIYLGADRHAELVRLALMHPTAEDFTIEETCSLERLDLIDAPVNGNLRLLEAAPMEDDYLRMMIDCAGVTSDLLSLPLITETKSLLNRPVSLRVGVIGEATKEIVEKFFAMVKCPAQIEAYPIDMSAAFRRHTRAAQKAFVQSLSADVGIGIWIGGIGERIQLALPGYGMLPRGRSDALIARLLLEQDRAAQLVVGWLFPNFSQSPSSRISRYDGCMLTAASLRSKNPATRTIGFDGRGAIAFPSAVSANESARQIPESCVVYPDAVMAMAFLLRALAKISREEFQAMIPGATLGYRLMPCPDEAKAYLMRRLVEAYDHLHSTFSDGTRLEEKDGTQPDWIVVRPCAGMPALEIYWEESSAHPTRKRKSRLETAIRRQLGRWREAHPSS
jgi:mannose-1-phosphate guanylyltransferase/phosphomannomutase